MGESGRDLEAPRGATMPLTERVEALKGTQGKVGAEKNLRGVSKGACSATGFERWEKVGDRSAGCQVRCSQESEPAHVV